MAPRLVGVTVTSVGTISTTPVGVSMIVSPGVHTGVRSIINCSGFECLAAVGAGYATVTPAPESHGYPASSVGHWCFNRRCIFTAMTVLPQLRLGGGWLEPGTLLRRVCADYRVAPANARYCVYLSLRGGRAFTPVGGHLPSPEPGEATVRLNPWTTVRAEAPLAGNGVVKWTTVILEASGDAPPYPARCAYVELSGSGTPFPGCTVVHSDSESVWLACYDYTSFTLSIRRCGPSSCSVEETHQQAPPIVEAVNLPSGVLAALEAPVRLGSAYRLVTMWLWLPVKTSDRLEAVRAALDYISGWELCSA